MLGLALEWSDEYVKVEWKLSAEVTAMVAVAVELDVAPSTLRSAIDLFALPPNTLSHAMLGHQVVTKALSTPLPAPPRPPGATPLLASLTAKTDIAVSVN